MNNIIKIVVKSDEDEAKVAKEKLNIKGYTTSILEAEKVVLDGTDLGGHLDFLSDVDGKVYFVMGKK